MRVLQLYNQYQSGGGGETRVVELIEQVLRTKHHEVKTLIRDNNTIHSAFSKVKLVLSAAYSPSAKKDIHQEILNWQPDIVHVHNLYPLFSPSVLAACAELNVPVVMTVHNYGLSCPAATHFRDGQPCQRCVGGHEYECILGNCKADMTKSVSYAFRSYVARKEQQFQQGVTLFLAISHFIKNQMVGAGYAADQIAVLENAVPMPENIEPGQGDFIAYLGRMLPEKGVDTLLAAASRLPQFRFVFVGEGPERARWTASAPANCSFLGTQDRKSVERIYRQARFTVMPSIWWEPFGLVAIEAMSYGRPVIAARSGGLPEIVQEGITGITFPPGDVDALTQAITSLWNDPAKARAMGLAGRDVANRNFNLSTYGDRLIRAYQLAQSRMLGTTGIARPGDGLASHAAVPTTSS